MSETYSFFAESTALASGCEANGACEPIKGQVASEELRRIVQDEVCTEKREPTVVGTSQRGDRRKEVELLEAYRDGFAGCSLLEFCQSHGLPESTMRHWLSRQDSTDGPAGWVDLVESPGGLAVLHQIVTAATFVITQVLGGGYRATSMFLELSRLSQVVASGYGTQYGAVKAMEEAIVEFGEEEHVRLGGQMAPKSITVAQDETFHGSCPCLVAIEPVSDFIMLEEYAEDRRAQTWNEAMSSALEGLPVEVFQSTGDEAKALLKHAHESLGAHHSPDLFHPQQDISRATSLPLERQIKAAADAADVAQHLHDALVEEAEEYGARRVGPGRPRDYASRIQAAKDEVEEATVRVEEAKARRRRVREAARTISAIYHPFDLESSEQRDAARAEAELEAQFTIIELAAEEAELSVKCHKLLKKARRVVPQMVATIALIHTLIQVKVEALGLTQDAKQVVLDRLVPSFYLDEAGKKASTAEQRSKLRSRAAELRAPRDQGADPLSRLDDGERTAVHEVALECAQLFQRSSSCVEGRNGVLALRRHSLHRLTPRKLAALTVVHNYGTTRADGTTAAGRFFGRRPRDLFVYLLDRLPPPARPAACRVTIH